MTESPDSTTESTVTEPTDYRNADHRDRRLHRTLAWVGIVAGVVFTVAVIFFSGLALGRASGGYGWHRGYQGGQMTPGGCPMMGPGGGMMGPGMKGPGMMGPGGMMDPDDMGPGMMRPGQSPSSTPGPAPSQR
jgi:hypothetical protein